MTSKESQTTQILNHILTAGSITSLEAIKFYNCLRLGARIFDLKDQGYNIKTQMVVTKSKKRIARYSL